MIYDRRKRFHPDQGVPRTGHGGALQGQSATQAHPKYVRKTERGRWSDCQYS